MKHWRNHRHIHWLRALLVGVLLIGELHVFSAEIFHDHSGGVASAGQFKSGAKTSCQAAQEVTPLCPLCQIVRNGSVRPAVQAAVQRPHGECVFRPPSREVRFGTDLVSLLPARAPPLS